MASPGKKSFPLRIDPAVWDALARLAGAEMRSVNAQIEYLLRESLARRGIKLKEDESPDVPGDSPKGCPARRKRSKRSTHGGRRRSPGHRLSPRRNRPYQRWAHVHQAAVRAVRTGAVGILNPAADHAFVRPATRRFGLCRGGSGRRIVRNPLRRCRPSRCAAGIAT